MTEPRNVPFYLAGRWTASNVLRDDVNPYTEEVIARVYQADFEHVQTAIRSAETAFEIWQDVACEERAKFLEAALEAVYANRNEIAHLISSEQGKPITEALTLEVIPSLDLLEYYAVKAPVYLCPEKVPYHQPHFNSKESRVFFVPLGTTAITTPSFAPWILPMATTALALLSGNAVILKPSTKTQLCGLKIAEIFDSVGLPEGLLTVITGDDKLADRMIAQPLQSVVYVGDRDGAQRFLDASNVNFKKAIISCGSKCPLVVFDDANLSASAVGAAWGAFSNAGQSHGNTSLLFVQHSVADQFKKLLIQRLEALRYGDPTSPETELGPVIDCEHFEHMNMLVSSAVAQGASILYRKDPPAGPSTSFYPLTLLDGVTNSMEFFTDPAAGPVAGIMEFQTDQELIELVNSLPFGLSASLWSGNGERVGAISRKIHFANIWVNDVMFPFEASNAPWGATRQSGNGQLASPYGLLEYVYLKHVGFDSKDGSSKDYYFPYGEELGDHMEQVLERLSSSNLLTRFLRRLRVKESPRAGKGLE
ncbi:MAG: aldehyde dehydrogenase [Planctomycetota bacterium]